MSELINNKYKMANNLLGTGAFAEVYLGIDIFTNQKIAIKKILLAHKNIKEETLKEKLKIEIILMQKLNHPNIVTYYDSCQKDTVWYIVMEYCDAGTIQNVIEFNESMSQMKSNNFNREKNTCYYLQQLKNALNHVRKAGYMHRDIKPLNILLTRSQREKITINNWNYDEKLIVKLADFGLARNCGENNTLMNTLCGSPLYMAPELIIKKEYNSQADLWSYGIIMYQLLFGVHPNNASNFEQLVHNLKSKDINFHSSTNFSPYCIDLLKSLLIKDPQHRIDWLCFFNHKWFIYWENENFSLSQNISKDEIGYATETRKGSCPIKILRDSDKKMLMDSTESLGIYLSHSESPTNPGFSNLSRMNMKLDRFSFSPKNNALGTCTDYLSNCSPPEPRKRNISTQDRFFFKSSVNPNKTSCFNIDDLNKSTLSINYCCVNPITSISNLCNSNVQIIQDYQPITGSAEPK